MHLLELNRLASVGNNRATDTRNPSLAIWQDCPWFDLINGTRDGIAFYDDFNRSMIQAANVAASATTLPDPWVAFTDATAASTISNISEPTDALGALSLAITTANEGMTLGLFTQKGLGTCISGGLASAASTPIANKVWLEARVKVSTIAINEIAFFFGLGLVAGEDVDLVLAGKCRRRYYDLGANLRPAPHQGLVAVGDGGVKLLGLAGSVLVPVADHLADAFQFFDRHRVLELEVGGVGEA